VADFLHLQPHHHKIDPRILHLRPHQLLDELVVAELPRAVVVEEVEELLQVVLLDVQLVEIRPNAFVLVAYHEFLHADAAAVVGVHFPHHFSPLPKASLHLILLGHHTFFLRPLPGLARLVNDNRKHQVCEAELHRDKRERENYVEGRTRLDDRDHAGPPGVSGDERLEEE